MQKYLLIALLLLLPVIAQEECTVTDSLQVELFYSTTCGHCAKLKPVLEKIDAECQAIDVSFIETSEEREKWLARVEEYNTSAVGVPMTFIADKVFIGFSNDFGNLTEYPNAPNAYIGYENQIIDELERHTGCDLYSLLGLNEDKKGVNNYWIFLLLPVYLLSYFIFEKKINRNKRLWYAGFFATLIICLFFFIATLPDTVIQNFALSLPFPLFVFIIALADGFNPCAFTVLIILLSLLTYTKRRRDMFIVGTVFIATSAVMYFIFIMVMVLVGSWAFETYGSTIMLILGSVILFAGVINLKDFFFFKKGVSLSISDKQKSKIMKKAGKIANELKQSRNIKMYALAIASTIILAVFVNLVELGCTAILPTVYMTYLLKTYGSTLAAGHVLWTAFYSVIYVIPLFAILLNFIYTFKSARLTEDQGRILKLAAGLFMIFFGMLMIFNPTMLNF